MGGIDILGLRKKYFLFLGSTIAEWILFIFGVLFLIKGIAFGYLFMVLWIENFFFWLILKIYEIKNGGNNNVMGGL